MTARKEINVSIHSISAAVFAVMLTAGLSVTTKPMHAQRGGQAPDAAGRGGPGSQGRGAEGGRGAGDQAGCPGEPAAKFFPCATERAKTFRPARMSDGKPDLQGFWQPGRSRRVIEAHPEEPGQGGLPAEASLVVDPPDGKIPFKPEGAARRANLMSQQETLKTSLEFMDPGARCFAKGVPRMHMNNPAFFEFVFTPTTLFILHEQNHVYEIIPLDGSPRLSKNIKLWMGDQRGHWEGDTLVVETTNHNGRSWIDDRGAHISDNAKVTERYTLIDPDVIFFVATIEDPTVFTRPWTMAFPLRRNKEPGLERMEFACHEGNRSNELQLAADKQ